MTLTPTLPALMMGADAFHVNGPIPFLTFLFFFVFFCSDEQFQWIARALGLRHVHIMTYGKINFVYTVLSKRKLNWFVNEKLVDGWNDARFPTIQGCIRRGLNVDSLRKFIISQGVLNNCYAHAALIAFLS